MISTVAGWLAQLFDPLAWLTALPIMSLIGGAGIVARLAGAFGLIPGAYGWLTRIGGVLLLFLFFWLAGYRTADVRADMQAKLDQAKAEVAEAKRDLLAQRVVANFAAIERDQARAALSQSDKKVADYEAELAKAKPPTACLIDDNDMRFYRSLRQSPDGPAR